jgi:hypothetical protein
MPAKPKPKPAEAEGEEEAETAETPAPDPTAKLLKQLADQLITLGKRLDATEKRLPKPTDDEAEKLLKQKESEERAAKVKAENDAMLGDYKEMLESKFGIKDGIESLEDARIAMRVAKGNKLDLQSLSEKMKGKDTKPGEQTPPKGQSYFDTTRLKEAIKQGE